MSQVVKLLRDLIALPVLTMHSSHPAIPTPVRNLSLTTSKTGRERPVSRSKLRQRIVAVTT